MNFHFNTSIIDSISITIDAQIQPNHVSLRRIRCYFCYFLLLLLIVGVLMGAYFIYVSSPQSIITIGANETLIQPGITTPVSTTTTDIWNPISI